MTGGAKRRLLFSVQECLQSFFFRHFFTLEASVLGVARAVTWILGLTVRFTVCMPVLEAFR
jgi:hypothetical protein